MSRINFLKIQLFSLEILQKRLRDTAETVWFRTKILVRPVFPLKLERCLLISLSSKNVEGMRYSAFENSAQKTRTGFSTVVFKTRGIASYPLYSDCIPGENQKMNGQSVLVMHPPLRACKKKIKNFKIFLYNLYFLNIIIYGSLLRAGESPHLFGSHLIHPDQP